METLSELVFNIFKTAWMMTHVAIFQAKPSFTDLILMMHFTFIHYHDLDLIKIVTCVKFISISDKFQLLDFSISY